MPDVQVIGLPQSNYVWAVRIALAEKGVAHESILAPPHSPEVAAIHPLGKIPVLRHGTVALAESRAIIDYVDATFDGPPLVPADGEAALRSAMWTSIITSSVEPLLVRQYVLAHMFPATEDGQPDRVLIEALAPKVEAALDVLDKAVSAGEIGGEGIERVDAYLVPILFYLSNTPAGGNMIAARSKLSEYLARRLAQPSVRSTMPPPPERS